jgi:hypothetical protein
LRHKPRPQDIQLADKQRSRTVKIVTIAFASAIALSAVAPAFAYENDLENGEPASSMRPSEHQAAVKHTNKHRGADAKAFMPNSEPVINAPVNMGVDFGIGSQS